MWLIETIHVGPVTPQDFAAGFDRAAELLHEQTGHTVRLDHRPDPAAGVRRPRRARSGGSAHDPKRPCAINPFSITAQGRVRSRIRSLISEDERLALRATS